MRQSPDSFTLRCDIPRDIYYQHAVTCILQQLLPCKGSNRSFQSYIYLHIYHVYILHFWFSESYSLSLVLLPCNMSVKDYYVYDDHNRNCKDDGDRCTMKVRHSPNQTGINTEPCRQADLAGKDKSVPGDKSLEAANVLGSGYISRCLITCE